MKSTRNEGVVVVIGATGTLGTYLVDELLSEGYSVVAVGRRNVQKCYYAKKNVTCARVDISKSDDFQNLPQAGVATVVHIAGSMPSRMVGYKAQTYIDVNISGTLNVLEYARTAGVARYIFTQSHSDVAGHWNTGKLINPNAPRLINFKGDHAIYIISKNTAVDLIEHYHQQYGLQTIVFRLPTIYNYRPISNMYVNGRKSVIAYRYLIKKAMAGEPLEIWGDPQREKDIVYVKDFNQMVIKAMNSAKAQGIYNVGSGIATTLEDQIKGIAQVFSPMDNPSEIVYCPDKPSQASYLYDISNAVSDFGYRPAFRYIEMLEDMKKEMMGHRFDHLVDADVTI